MGNKKRDIILLIALSAFLFLFGLGRMALTDPDEPFYAETAKEMLARGEWLTPRIFGAPQFEKPALYYWLVILSYKVFGVNEFAARFPSAIFGVLGIIGIYFIGSILFTRKSGVYAALVMTASLFYFILARACVTDMVLAVFILYAFLFYMRGYLNNSEKLFYPLAAVSLGLAVLTKGPVGLVLPFLTVGLYLLYKKDLKAILKFPVITSIFVFLIIAMPWYVLMAKTYGDDFIGHFFGFQNITRFMHPEHKIGDVFYFYVPVLFAGFFPWSVFLPYGIRHVFRFDKEKFQSHIFLLIWVAVFFIFFSISRTKLVTYIFPLFPALAVFSGRFIELTLEKGRFDLGEKISGIFYILSLAAGAVIFYVVCLIKYPLMKQASIYNGIFFLICAAISLYVLLKHKKEYFFFSIFIVMAMLMTFVTVTLAKPVGLHESSKFIVEEIKKRMKPGEKIGAETDYQRGVAFYTGTEDILDIHPHHVLTSFLNSGKRVWGILKDKNHWQLYTDDVKPFKKPTYVVYKLGKKVIITNKIPDDGKYIKKRSISNPR